MKKMKRTNTMIKSTFLGILIILSLSCGGREDTRDGKITIRFWHSFVSSTVPALNDLIEKFESEHPDVKILAQYVPTGDALMQKLITAVQSNTAPDISWIHSDYLQDLVAADAIFKMDHFIKGPNGISDADLADIYAPLIQYASWKGTLYSIPLEATNIALLYNKDHFRAAGLDPEKPPQDWDELLEYARRLTLDNDGDGKMDQTGLFLPVFPASGPLGGWMVWQWYPFLWQAGGKLIEDDQSRVLYNEEPGIKALDLWKKLYNEQDLSKFTTDYDVAFASGRLSMAFDGPWNLPRFSTLLKDIDWAFATLPAGPAGPATIVGGEYLTIFKQSEHPDHAWEFIKWVIEPENQAFWSMKSGYLPIRKSTRDDPEFNEYLDRNPNFKVFVDQMDISKAQRPIDHHAMKITNHIAMAIETTVVGNRDPKEVLDNFAGQSNKLLESVGKE